MGNRIKIHPLTRERFAPFGEVIEKGHADHFLINDGMCTRFHNLAEIDIVGGEAKPIISIFAGQPYDLPLTLKMVERHPLGSQAFMPLSHRPFLVIACEDRSGEPGQPCAFITAPDQGINFARNTWHGVLTPLDEPADFLVVDRAGAGNNLEEHFFAEPYIIAMD